MAGRSVTPKPTNVDAISYVRSVREAFHDEPAKYREFIMLMKDYNRGVGLNSVIAKVEELLKDHRNLLLGFSIFLPDGATITIPPEADKARSTPSTPIKEDLDSYLTAVKEAFHDDPRKYDVFSKVLCYIIQHGLLSISGGGIESLEHLLKDHQNLLLRLNNFIPAETQRILHQRAESDDNKRKRIAGFIGKLKARFQGDGRSVYESFTEILKMYQEGNKSGNEFYKEFFELVQGHEDLAMDFSEIFKSFKRSTDPSGSNSARDS
ncbi:PREDICTED: paired amphipathic helix protein Sin3-like 5 [Camelina sativa]|uniref:Paired amphipathic helix protein Sin3-like 5 n=1 Tax=Camelina sativa TaxID=90675 RepID=A0ABM0YIU5_CAMSA|nr:PREDICTED: paired amphipathic helix protein Sin3-like 5 [Camelina sativa]